MVVTTAAVWMAAVVAVVGNNCDNGDDGSGVDGSGDDGGCGDGKCNGGSSSNGNRNCEVTMTTVVKAMAVGGNTTIN